VTSMVHHLVLARPPILVPLQTVALNVLLTLNVQATELASMRNVVILVLALVVSMLSAMSSITSYTVHAQNMIQEIHSRAASPSLLHVRTLSRLFFPIFNSNVLSCYYLSKRTRV
jgi:hypothetical protein